MQDTGNTTVTAREHFRKTLTAEQVGERVGLHPKSIRIKALRGTFPAPLNPRRRPLKWCADTVEQWALRGRRKMLLTAEFNKHVSISILQRVVADEQMHQAFRDQAAEMLRGYELLRGRPVRVSDMHEMSLEVVRFPWSEGFDPSEKALRDVADNTERMRRQWSEIERLQGNEHLADGGDEQTN